MPRCLEVVELFSSLNLYSHPAARVHPVTEPPILEQD